MGASLEKLRTGVLHEPTCSAMRECSGPYGWTIETLRNSLASHTATLAHGSFILTSKQFAELFDFLKSPENEELCLASQKTKADLETSRASNKSVLNEEYSPENQKGDFAKTSTLRNQIATKSKTTTRKRAMSKRKSKSGANEAMSQNNKSVVKEENLSASQDEKSSNMFNLNVSLDHDPMMRLYNHLKQRNKSPSRSEECSYFVAATALALCSRSRMESRLHFLYDLFHSDGGYGGAHVASDQEFGGKLMTMKELVFMAWTSLRALCAISYGHVDHIDFSLHEVRQTCVQLVRLMESTNRGFNHKQGFSWTEFERFIHSYVFSGAAWIYALLDDCSFTFSENNHGNSASLKGKLDFRHKKSSEGDDPYEISSLDAEYDLDKGHSKLSEEKKYGPRASRFRASSKGQIVVDIVSLASSDFDGSSKNATSASSAIGGTAFTCVLRPMLNNVQQTASRRSKPKALDGAGIISWNARVYFTDTGEGTEAASDKLKYGFDVELRVGETVCGGCFVDMFDLIDGGRFGMQVQMRSVRGKKGWGGGRIGKLRLSAEHIPRHVPSAPREIAD